MPRPTKGRNGEEAKERTSHIGCVILSQIAGLRDDLLQHSIRNTKNSRSGAAKSNTCSFPKWNKFVSHAVFTLRTCDRMLSATTMNVPVSSVSKEIKVKSFLDIFSSERVFLIKL